jgi:cytosine deaminase
LTLPGLVEPHAHLDKTYTIERCRPAEPGLLAAIRAMQDRRHWTGRIFNAGRPPRWPGRRPMA